VMEGRRHHHHQQDRPTTVMFHDSHEDSTHIHFSWEIPLDSTCRDAGCRYAVLDAVPPTPETTRGRT